MAQRRRRASTRRGKAAKRSRAPRRAKARGKTAKRSAARATLKKGAASAKAKRAVAKKAPPKKTKPLKLVPEPPVEVIAVERIEEPVPGVVVVTEDVSVRVRGRRRGKVAERAAEPAAGQGNAGIPESNEE